MWIYSLIINYNLNYLILLIKLNKKIYFGEGWEEYNYILIYMYYCYLRMMCYFFVVFYMYCNIWSYN